MQFKTLIFFLLISASCFSQEIGSAKNGNHSIKLLKSNNLFSFVYSNINSEILNDENSFNFPNINTMLQIVKSGFAYHNDHQVIIQTNKDTIVKFDFKKVKGKKMLMIRQNSLLSEKTSTSTFFTKNEIIGLFGNP
ncbi:hypothetical protein [uncultured Lutibacter sp.]|uniref:hypothetical protein n=1 Tax=uncultured Lutibacter sp. TaxID=437739 RepID=UPI0026259804|nr:hypothetical protein [uncultured Lutibacter sp.]